MRPRTLAIALLAAVAVTGAAHGEDRTPGVTDTEVLIGLSAPLSGPAAARGNTAMAMEAWARYVNDQGGVHGRKIKVELKDDGFNPARAVANLKEMKDSVFLNAGLRGSAVLTAAKNDIAEYKLLTVNPYGNPSLWAKQPKDKLRYVFVNYPDSRDEGEFLVKQSVERLGARKVAVFYQNDDYGRGGLEGVNRGLQGFGGKGVFAGAVPYELADRDLGPHALRLRESGADAVIIYSTIMHGARVVKEMAKAGYRPQLVASFPLGDYTIMYRLLGELWEGAHFTDLNAAAGDPAGKVIVDVLTRYEPRLVGKEHTALSGAVAMIIAVEGLKKAGRNLTREGYVDAMESIKAFTTLGLTAPVTFGPNQHHGLNAVRLLRANKAADSSYAEVLPWQIFKPLF